MKLIVSLLIEDNVFSFKTGHGNENTEFTDLFYDGTVEIASSILIDEYLQTVWGNWKAAEARDLNPYEKNTEIVATAVVEREAYLAEESDDDL